MKIRAVIGYLASTLIVSSILTFALLSEIASAHGPECKGHHKSDAGCDGGGGGDGESEGNPSFVYSTIGDGGVMRVMDADGSNNRRLSQIAATYAIFGPTPHWGPGGQEVAWVDWKFNRWSGIVVVRLDGGAHPAGDPCAGETSCLLFEDTANLEAFSFLDWGVPACIEGSDFSDRFIAFLGRGYIYDPDQVDFDVFLINRENPSMLINVTETRGEGLNALTWSDDGQRIAVHAVSEPPDEWGVSSYIAIIDVCGQGFPRAEVPLPTNHPIQGVQFLDWGTNFGVDYIAVTTSGGVWIVEVVTGTSAPTPIHITTSDNQFNDPYQAIWSPDGTMMAVAYAESDGGGAIAILDVTDVFNPVLVRTIHPTKRAGRIDWRLEDNP